MDFENVYISNKQQKLFGRYITLDHIEPILQELNFNNQLEIIGLSVQQKPIYQYTIGTGKIKVLIWSQMHGNESTTTKAIFDFLNLLKSSTNLSNNLLENFTFCIVPILNPDGAALYTRENANNIDLNRDFKDFSQPESKALMQLFNEFKPHYCYNMHDQRTIYGAGNTGKPATVSFLAPSFNENCDFNENRLQAAAIIIAINKVLQEFIPNQIGRFDDAYNENCAGDSFQKLGVPTILFEAGHYQEDYEREITRKYIFIGLVASFQSVLDLKIINIIANYELIPKNKVCFYDIIYKNVKTISNYNNISITFALNYKEILIDNKIVFQAVVSAIDNLENYYGHLEIDAKKQVFVSSTTIYSQLDAKANFKIGNNEIIFGKLTNS